MTPPALIDAAVWAAVERALQARRHLTFAIGEAVAQITYGGFVYDSAMQAWTTVSVTVAPSSLCLDVTPRSALANLAARLGLALDVRTGDAAFDALYRVEAAPCDLARALLDDEGRAALRAIHPAHLTLAARELVVHCVEPPEIEVERATVRLAAALTARVAAFAREGEARGADSVDPTGHYRCGADGWRVREETRRAELARLLAVKERRLAAMAVAVGVSAAGVLAVTMRS